jgi:hypothetical protein
MKPEDRSPEDRGEEILAYLADTLEGPERDAVEKLLADPDPAAAAGLAQARDTLASLALGLDPVAPSRGVRERILGRLRAVPAPQPVSAPSAAGELWKPIVGAALAAGVVAVVGAWFTHRIFVEPLALQNAELVAVNEELVAERAEFEAEIEELDAAVDELRSAARQAELQVALLRTPDLIVAHLTGSDAQPDASARIFWDRVDYRCYLHTKGLEPAREGHRLVLWLFLADGQIHKVGTLEPDFAGESTLFAELPRDAHNIVRAVVTEEAGAPGAAPAGPEQLSWTAETTAS